MVFTRRPAAAHDADLLTSFDSLSGFDVDGSKVAVVEAHPVPAVGSDVLPDEPAGMIRDTV
jgi:hypothetical protein